MPFLAVQHLLTEELFLPGPWKEGPDHFTAGLEMLHHSVQGQATMGLLFKYHEYPGHLLLIFRPPFTPRATRSQNSRDPVHPHLTQDLTYSRHLIHSSNPFAYKVERPTSCFLGMSRQCHSLVHMNTQQQNCVLLQLCRPKA